MAPPAGTRGMSALIKSSSAAGAAPSAPVRPFAFDGGAAEPAAPVQISRESLLEERIAELEAERMKLAQELERALELAREEGAREALKERSAAEADALEALGKTLEAALALWRERLNSWEGAAAGISRAVLEQVFTGAQDRAALVEAAIAKRIERLDRASLVRVRVSAEDFGDEKALAAAARLGRAIELERDAELATGACLIDLKLGHVDLSLSSQWPRISELLGRLEGEGSSS